MHTHLLTLIAVSVADSPANNRVDAELMGKGQTMPANYIVKKVHDIIGCRCARRPCPIAQPLCAHAC